jgi:hypothetical protein
MTCQQKDPGLREVRLRRQLRYGQFGDLCSEISLVLNADDAVLDGEIVKLDESGRPIFLEPHPPPWAVSIRGLRRAHAEWQGRPQTRARGSQELAPQHHAEALEVDPLRTACRRSRPGAVLRPRSRGHRREAEGLGLRPCVAAGALAKIKNRDYSQARDRHELFERA